VHRKNIPIHNQQDATLRSLLYLATALHVSGGTSTHHHERKQLYLQHLAFVTPLLIPAAIVEEFHDSRYQGRVPRKRTAIDPRNLRLEKCWGQRMEASFE
jgi:hypothetical protein